MRIRVFLAPAAAVLSLMAAGQSLAQTSLDDPLDDRSAKRLDRMEKVMRELRAIVFQGRETGQPVIVQPAETESQITALNEKINDLEQSLTRLNSQLEAGSHASDDTRRQLAALREENAQLKAQLAAMDQKMAALSSLPPPQVEAPAPADPDTAFSAARRLLLDGDYAGAEGAFSDFIQRFGDSPRGQEARYYLAKTLIARRAWPEAATNDIGALRGYPQTPWAAEAMLDLARSLVAMKKPEDACQTLAELARRYPKANMDVKNRAANLKTQAKCAA